MGTTTFQGSPLANSEYEVKVPKSGLSIEALKDLVRNVIGSPANGRYLRLISSGKMLAPDSAKVESFDLKDNDCIHAVVSPAGVRGGIQAAMARGERDTLDTYSDESESSDDEDDLENGLGRRGFDRLRSTGLSRHEITAIRLYFAPQVEEYIESRPPSREPNARTESDPSALRLQMEEEWMATQGPTSEFRLNLNMNQTNILSSIRGGIRFEEARGRPEGTDRDFLFGFLIGIFVGPICLLWVWMPTISQKQKLGILLGISFKIFTHAFDSDSSEEMAVVQT